jgi:hypothetical protein
MLRRLLFASSIVLGLAFAAVCYAEMFGVFQFDSAGDCKASAMRMPLTSISCKVEDRLKIAGLELYRPHFLEFVAACVAEASQKIDRAIDRHFAQLDKTFVRLQISV